MRVIAGKYKRRLLKTLPGIDVTRPTSDRAKESLFNMLTPDIQGAIVIDLFAGSGALGIEALSRGARHVTFVEESRTALQVIQENLKTLNIPQETYNLVGSSVQHFLRVGAIGKSSNAANPAALASIVLADPPYQSSWYDEALDSLAAAGVCASDCLVVLEMKTGRTTSQPLSSSWELVDERKYGIAQFQFWRFLEGRRSHSDEADA